jgi:uncharacterized protein YndB with AHSA1/START domain
MTFNESLDLRFERKVNCSPAHLWKGWTDPETLKKWFCPLPWKVTGGAIYRATVMHRTPADRDTHAKMGFEKGWGIALDQLVSLA